MNLSLRFTRALSSLRSFSRCTNQLSSRSVSALALGVSGALLLGLGLGVHAESRPAHLPSTAASIAPESALHGALHLSGQRYELRMHHLHTGETIDVVYRVGNTYIPSALAELNHFLRDHRTQDVSHYDPREFDVLHSVMARLGRPDGMIDVVCGYRTPWSNNFLRTRGGTAPPSETGVAQHSQHMLAKAIDIRVPGVSTSRLRDAALSLKAGGVGYYPVSGFVHVDVGPVRQWTFAGAE